MITSHTIQIYFFRTFIPGFRVNNWLPGPPEW